MARDDIIKVAMGILLDTKEADKDLSKINDDLSKMITDWATELRAETVKAAESGTKAGGKTAPQILASIREKIKTKIKEFEGDGDEIATRILKGVEDSLQQSDFSLEFGNAQKATVIKNSTAWGEKWAENAARIANLMLQEKLGDFASMTGLQKSIFKSEMLGGPGLHQPISKTGPVRGSLQTLMGAAAGSGGGDPSIDLGITRMLGGGGGGLGRGVGTPSLPPESSRVQADLVKITQDYHRILTRIQQLYQDFDGDLEKVNSELHQQVEEYKEIARRSRIAADMLANYQRHVDEGAISEENAIEINRKMATSMQNGATQTKTRFDALAPSINKVKKEYQETIRDEKASTKVKDKLQKKIDELTAKYVAHGGKLERVQKVYKTVDESLGEIVTEQEKLITSLNIVNKELGKSANKVEGYENTWSSLANQAKGPLKSAIADFMEDLRATGRAADYTDRQMEQLEETFAKAALQTRANGGSIKTLRREIKKLGAEGLPPMEAIAQAGARQGRFFSNWEKQISKVMLWAGGLRMIAGVFREMAQFVGEVSRGMFELAEKSAQLVDAETGFRRLAAAMKDVNGNLIDVNTSLADIKNAAGGAIDEFTLMEQSTKGALAGIAPDRFAEIVTAARALAAVTGRTAPEALERLTGAIGKQERRLLDELGIVVRAEDLYKRYADQIDKASDSLTANEKVMAFMEGTLEKVNAKVAILGGVVEDAQAPFIRFTKAWRELTLEAGEWIRTNDFLQDVLFDIEHAIIGVTNALRDESAVLADYEARQKAVNLELDGFKTMLEGTGEAGEVSVKRMKDLFGTLNQMKVDGVADKLQFNRLNEEFKAVMTTMRTQFPEFVKFMSLGGVSTEEFSEAMDNLSNSVRERLGFVKRFEDVQFEANPHLRALTLAKAYENLAEAEDKETKAKERSRIATEELGKASLSGIRGDSPEAIKAQLKAGAERMQLQVAMGGDVGYTQVMDAMSIEAFEATSQKEYDAWEKAQKESVTAANQLETQTKAYISQLQKLFKADEDLAAVFEKAGFMDKGKGEWGRTEEGDRWTYPAMEALVQMFPDPNEIDALRNLEKGSKGQFSIGGLITEALNSLVEPDTSATTQSELTDLITSIYSKAGKSLSSAASDPTALKEVLGVSDAIEENLLNAIVGKRPSESFGGSGRVGNLVIKANLQNAIDRIIPVVENLMRLTSMGVHEELSGPVGDEFRANKALTNRFSKLFEIDEEVIQTLVKARDASTKARKAYIDSVADDRIAETKRSVALARTVFTDKIKSIDNAQQAWDKGLENVKGLGNPEVLSLFNIAYDIETAKLTLARQKESDSRADKTEKTRQSEALKALRKRISDADQKLLTELSVIQGRRDLTTLQKLEAIQKKRKENTQKIRAVSGGSYGDPEGELHFTEITGAPDILNKRLAVNSTNIAKAETNVKNNKLDTDKALLRERIRMLKQQTSASLSEAKKARGEGEMSDQEARASLIEAHRVTYVSRLSGEWRTLLQDMKDSGLFDADEIKKFENDWGLAQDAVAKTRKEIQELAEKDLKSFLASSEQRIERIEAATSIRAINNILAAQKKASDQITDKTQEGEEEARKKTEEADAEADSRGATLLSERLKKTEQKMLGHHRSQVEMQVDSLLKQETAFEAFVEKEKRIIDDSTIENKGARKSALDALVVTYGERVVDQIGRVRLQGDRKLKLDLLQNDAAFQDMSFKEREEHLEKVQLLEIRNEIAIQTETLKIVQQGLLRRIEIARATDNKSEVTTLSNSLTEIARSLELIRDLDPVAIMTSRDKEKDLQTLQDYTMAYIDLGVALADLGGMSSETVGAFEKIAKSSVQLGTAIASQNPLVILAATIDSIKTLTELMEEAKLVERAKKIYLEVDRHLSEVSRWRELGGSIGGQISEGIEEGVEIDVTKIVEAFAKQELGKRLTDVIAGDLHDESERVTLASQQLMVNQATGAQRTSLRASYVDENFRTAKTQFENIPNRGFRKGGGIDPDLLKQAILRHYSPILYGRTQDLLDFVDKKSGWGSGKNFSKNELDDLIRLAEDLRFDKKVDLQDATRRLRTSSEDSTRRLESELGPGFGFGTDGGGELSENIPTAAFRAVTEPQANQMLLIMTQQVTHLQKIEMHTSVLPGMADNIAGAVSGGSPFATYSVNMATRNGGGTQ